MKLFKQLCVIPKDKAKSSVLGLIWERCTSHSISVCVAYAYGALGYDRLLCFFLGFRHIFPHCKKKKILCLQAFFNFFVMNSPVKLKFQWPFFVVEIFSIYFTN